MLEVPVYGAIPLCSQPGAFTARAPNSTHSLRHRSFGVTAAMERMPLERMWFCCVCLQSFLLECSFSSSAHSTSIQGLSPFPAPSPGGTRCRVDVPSVTSRTWGFRMCLKNQLHQRGWVFDLVCSCLGLIHKLSRGDEIRVGFSGVEYERFPSLHSLGKKRRKCGCG